MTARLARCAVLAVAVSISGCAVKTARIVSPYQTALATYYKALETGQPADLDAAEKEATALLSNDSGDQTARILRANVLLSRLRARLDPEIRRRFLNDLKVLSSSIGSPADTLDWVPARASVSMGDLLVLEGSEQLKNAGADVNKLTLARALFEAARHFYSGAAAVADAKPNGTPGLVREGANARSGHISTIRGALEAIDKIDPNQAFPLTRATRQELLDLWDAQARTKAVQAASSPVLSFDPDEQRGMKALYVRLGNDAFQKVLAWCPGAAAALAKDPAALTPPEKALLDDGMKLYRRTLSMRDMEAIHAAVEVLLRGQAESVDSSLAVNSAILLPRTLPALCAPGSQ